MGSINKDIARFELTAVYKHPLAKADIVLVHGLNGNPQKTWTAKNGVYWPTDLLPVSLKDEHANVLVYGYNADVYSSKKDQSPSANFIHMHAQSLVTSLTQYRKSEGTERSPIIWVAHSLGGIVTKRALLYSNDVRAHHHEDFRSIFVSTYGIIFLGTPHTGSDLAGWGRILQAMSDAVVPRRFFETEPILLKTLKKDNETLQAINSHFLDIYQRFRIFMVHENHTTDIKGTRAIVVDAASASPQLPGVTYFGIEANHSGMCKFESENAPGYRNVSTGIREWVADSPKIIAVRWEVEEDDRRLRASLESYERTRSYRTTTNERAPDRADRVSARVPQPPQPIIEEASSRSSSTANNDMTLVATVPAAPAMMIGPLVESPTRAHAVEAPPSRVDSMPRDGPLFIHPEKFRPNSYFVGREDELRGLHEMLMDRKRRSEGTSAVLIQCMPGGGKTHLARQYVFQHKDDYPSGVYWVRAKSRKEMEYWYWRIAKNEALRGLLDQRDRDELRDPKRIVQMVRKWLNHQSGWLLVLDGVQFDTPGLREFIPDARNTSLIYTSTERAVTGDPHFDNPQVMELGLLTAQQAQGLLLTEIAKKEPWSPEDKARALELVQLMGRLPLMIHVAAQHLKATREPLSRYLRSYRSRPKAGGLPAYKAVREQLEHRGANAALNLISLLVFFDQHIPVEMVSMGLSALDKTTPIKSCDASHQKTNLSNTLRTLIAFALVERTESDDISSSSSRSSRKSFDKHADYLDILRIHSVVQAFFIDTLHEERQAEFWLERAIRMWCRSYDEADKRIDEDARVGLPDDYRRFSIHGEKLREHLSRFERRYPGLQKARLDVEARLDKMQAQIDELSQALQAKIVNGSNEEPPASVFDRANSLSETDSAETPNHDSQNSWEPFSAGDGESPDRMQSMSPIFDPALPTSPTEWQIPYPTRPLMPAPQTPDDDDETVVWNNTQSLQSLQSPRLMAVDREVVDPTSQHEYEDWQEVIPNHRVIKRHESRRYHDRAGAWRDKTVSDPRIGVSKESAVGSLTSRRPESRSPSRSRVTAQSDAEMELNKLRQTQPVSSEPATSSTSGPVRPKYLLGKNSYAPVSARTVPETDLTVAPVPFSSGLAQIMSSPKSWTAATVKRLKENVLPSRPPPATGAPVTPVSPLVSQGEDITPAPHSSIFRGSRTANSSPANRSSPFPPPTFSALREDLTADDFEQSNLPAAIRSWDSNIYHPGFSRLDSSSPTIEQEPLSLSFPTILPTRAGRANAPPPIWIRGAPPAGYSSQPASHQSATPPTYEPHSAPSASGSPQHQNLLFPPRRPGTHHSSPLATSIDNRSSMLSDRDRVREVDPARLGPISRFASRRASYTETEPSPRRDSLFPDVDTSYSRWERMHHQQQQGYPAATGPETAIGTGAATGTRTDVGSSFPPPGPGTAAQYRIGRAGGAARGRRSSPSQGSGSRSVSPIAGAGGNAKGKGKASPDLLVLGTGGFAGLPLPGGFAAGGEPMARSGSGGSSGSGTGTASGVAGIRVGGTMVEFGTATRTSPGTGTPTPTGTRGRSSSSPEEHHGLGISTQAHENLPRAR